MARKKKRSTVGSKDTIIRAISKNLDRQLQRLFREEKKKENLKTHPQKISFVSITKKVKVVKK